MAICSALALDHCLPTERIDASFAGDASAGNQLTEGYLTRALGAKPVRRCGKIKYWEMDKILANRCVPHATGAIAPLEKG